MLVLGSKIGADSYVWKSLPGNSAYDVTVHAPGIKHFDGSPTPTEYQLYIKANSVNISSSPSANFYVGQNISFAVGGLPDGIDPTKTTYQWSAFPGTWVNDSTNPIPGVSSVNYFENADWLTNAMPSAWWVSGGSPANYYITVSVQIVFTNGYQTSANANGTLTMYRPDVSWTGSITGPISVDDNTYEYSGMYLHFGYYSGAGNKPGITFALTGTWTNGGSFHTEQLYDSVDSEACGTNGQTLHLSGNGIDIGPDALKSTDGVHYHDDPGLGCASDNSHVLDKNSFHTYMMFNPNIPSTPLSSITVPLKVIAWNWAGAADAEGGWHLTPNSTNASITVNGIDTTDFPSWTNIINGNDVTGFTKTTNRECY